MKRILVCLDNSSLAAGVHRTAIYIARNNQAKISLFRVIEGAGEVAGTHEDLIGVAKAELDRVGRKDPPEVVSGFPRRRQ
jgi:hypothetical protein